MGDHRERALREGAAEARRPGEGRLQVGAEAEQSRRWRQEEKLQVEDFAMSPPPLRRRPVLSAWSLRRSRVRVVIFILFFCK